MYAVIKTGGKQYRVAADDIIEIEKLPAEVGETVAFPHVLMVAGSGGTEIGKPMVAGATVAGEIIEQTRGDKVISFKKRRRHNSRRKRGHRQELTVVKITEILTGGAKPSKAAKTLAAEGGWGVTTDRGGAHYAARKGFGLAAITGGVAAAAGRAAGAASSAGLRGAAGGSASQGTAAAGRTGSASGATAPAGKSASAGRAFGLLSAPEGKADDLTRIGGVGEKIAATLHQHGIHHYWQLAAMTDKDIADIERDLAFPGRIKREEWREQARDLMAGKPPRAKVDRGEGHDAGATGASRSFRRLPSPEGKADDLTLIGGVGEKIAATLNQHGIFHFWQIAAMTAKDIAEVESDLAFPGRIEREEWREQSRDLMAGKPPRAKVDRGGQ